MYTVYLLSLLYQGTPGKSVWAGKPVGKTGSRADATSGHRQRLGETPNVAWEGKRANGKSSFLSWAKHSTPLLTGQEKRADDSSLPSHSCGGHPATLVPAYQNLHLRVRPAGSRWILDLSEPAKWESRAARAASSLFCLSGTYCLPSPCLICCYEGG